MADFRKAFAITERNEGGLANNKEDRGGLTYVGIAENYWPTWKGWPFVKAEIARHGKDTATINAHLAAHPDVKPLVEEFYKKNFWDTLKLDLLNDQQLANAVYDFGVNAGIGTSAKKLQSAANTIGAKLTIDGQIGAKTIEAINNIPAMAIYGAFNAQRRSYYNAIAERDASQKQFLTGWLKRIKPYQV